MLGLNFKDKNLKIVEKFWIFLLISVVIIVAGLVDTFFVRNMNLGVEFSGGSNIEVSVGISDFDQGKFETAVKNWLGGDRDNDGAVESKAYEVDGNVQKSGADLSTFSFRIGMSMVEDGKTVDLNDKPEGAEQILLITENEEIKTELKTYLEGYFGNNTTVEVETHVIGNDVKNYTVRTAFIAVAVAVAIILIYIAIRFNLLAGVSAVIALLHDVLIMVALTTIFQVPVNMTFIAAVITIVGYSINATIVVFDRIREIHALPSNADKTDAEIANEAIAGTLTRSILTTITTLVMIVALAIFGSTAIREFAFPIIFGLLAGAYSSVLLSASLWVKLRKAFGQENAKPAKKAKKS